MLKKKKKSVRQMRKRVWRGKSEIILKMSFCKIPKPNDRLNFKKKKKNTWQGRPKRKKKLRTLLWKKKKMRQLSKQQTQSDEIKIMLII